MKSLISYIKVIGVLLLTFQINLSWAQTFVFHFVAPKNVISNNFPGKLDQANCPPGYSKVKLTSANAAIFDKIAPSRIKLVFTQLQPGKELRSILDSSSNRTDSSVKIFEYWLVDDRTSFKVSKKYSAGNFKVKSDSVANYIWPSDTIYKSRSGVNKREVKLGEHFLEKAVSGKYPRPNFWVLEWQLLYNKFYRHIDLCFSLDESVKDMFEEELNYVTVNVRKKRDSGNNFTDRVTFDKKYVSEHGITWNTTYAIGEDKNPDMYQYMVQWSFRGGNVFPLTPQWEQGQMQAVTLYPPVVLCTIEFEADLEKLKAANISRVTLQVRYKKFNEEYEENIDISPVKKDSLVSKILYTDRNTRGFVYRLIFNHTIEDKLTLPWEVMSDDNYVFVDATILDGLLDKNSELFKKAVTEGKIGSRTDPYGKVLGNKVLDSFKDVMNVNKKN